VIAPRSSSPPLKSPAPPRAQIVGLKLHPPVFRTARAGASTRSASGQGGTTIRYYDSQPALTLFTVLAARAGVLNAAGHCVAPPRSAAAARGSRLKSCTRYIAVARFYRRDSAGANSFHFSGRIGRARLAAGRYRLALVPFLNGQAGAAAEAPFRVIS
jgi:hypothetical protein